ncbi:MAG: type II restriction endonuclease [Synergistaceae bacterium]|nr:type II restriction endonuclease [Synergistaceae bacterium]
METESIAVQATEAASTGQMVFCKFLSSNDTGETGGHQAGIYVSKPALKILFEEPGERGQNKDKRVTVKWQNEFETSTRFSYYGRGTRNEYRITNFGGRDFPFLRPEYTGALFILIKNMKDYYYGFILNAEEEINFFLDTFGLSPADTNRLIDTRGTVPQNAENDAINNFLSRLISDFPTSEEMSVAARNIQNMVFNNESMVFTNPDRKLIDWTEMEYQLFRAVEHKKYGALITNGFKSVEEFIVLANQVLNRRKSRAGKSLEHHLAAIFDGNKIRYAAQAVTEENKKPDFLFPSQEAYHDRCFPDSRLISLAAKTTCKDRWRQILNEADRLRGKAKYLCTLQQGISVAQMDEMQKEQVVLVVPEPYIQSYPETRRDRIWTVKKFIEYVKETEKEAV